MKRTLFGRAMTFGLMICAWRPAAAEPTYAATQAKTLYVAPLSQTTQPSYVPQSVALSGPGELGDHEPGAPIPPGYTPVPRARKGLIIGGAVTFGVLYSFSVLAASAAADGGPNGRADALWIPVIGPFAQIANTDAAAGRSLLAMDGMGQLAGMTMLVIGLVTEKTVLRRNDLVAPVARVQPLLGKGMAGAALGGTF